MGRRLGTRDVVLSGFLCCVGLAGWLHWSITDPSFDQTEAQSEWAYVLGFSALILFLVGGAAALGRALSAAPTVRRITTALLILGGLAAATNIVEDGLGVDEAFVVFALLTGAQLLALLALAIVLGLKLRGGQRILALVPLATVIGVIVYVDAGGPILLGTWCAAAAVLLVTRRSTRAEQRSPAT
jgi:hypothetical protein